MRALYDLSMRKGVTYMLAVFGVAWCAQATQAQFVEKSVPPEPVLGGMSVTELAQNKLLLASDLKAQMPVGADKDPIVVELTAKDRAAIAEPTQGPAPLRIGMAKSLPQAVRVVNGIGWKRGVTETAKDGKSVWAVTVNSPGAQAIRLHLTKVSLPAGAEMYFYAPDGEGYGPYTGTGRNNTGDFWTRAIDGDTGVIQVYYDQANSKGISFAISEVGHISGRSNGGPQVVEKSHDSWPCADNVSCLVDANCVNNSATNAAKDAIAKMEWIQGPYIYTCTGGLIADTDGSTQIPYFLTANHCLSNSNSSLETFFFYTTDSCNGACPDSLVTGGTPPAASTVGFTVVSSSSNSSDYTLGTLDEAPPAGTVFLGWNNSPIASADGTHLYRISNANFGPQVYSQHDVDNSGPTCQGIPHGDWIYSKDQTGATMGGSSGSPVLNSNGEIVGQLTGCCGYNCGNECDSANNWTIDGALAAYYSNVAQYLDPQSSGGSCDNDGVCEAGEDCNNCPNDCRAKTGGNPNSRYCCDGDLPDCGNANCNSNGWVCGGSGGGCTTNGDCDDGLFCNGAETCSGGSCQSGSDPCPGQGCDEGTDSCISCGARRDPCSQNSDCCSNSCRRGRCR